MERLSSNGDQGLVVIGLTEDIEVEALSFAIQLFLDQQRSLDIPDNPEEIEKRVEGDRAVQQTLQELEEGKRILSGEYDLRLAHLALSRLNLIFDASVKFGRQEAVAQEHDITFQQFVDYAITSSMLLHMVPEPARLAVADN